MQDPKKTDPKECDQYDVGILENIWEEDEKEAMSE